MKRSLQLKTRILNLFRIPFTYFPLENLLQAIIRGKRYQSFLARIVPNPLLYRFGSMRNVTRNGIKYSLDLSCMMQWYVYWDFSAKDREELYALIKEGDVVMDIGTNIGETLLNFARLTGPKGYVYGFEPDEENYKNAIKNISLNNFENIYVFKNALSDKKETVKLYVVDPNNRGMNRILQQANDETEPYTVLETITLDELVKENKIERINVMKLDIEGYEMNALRGATEILRKMKPLLFVEVGYTRLLKNNTSPNELMKFLEDHGYKMKHAQTDEQISSAYDFAYLGDNGFDIVAIPVHK
jgi:FkbM family methyltransferase